MKVLKHNCEMQISFHSSDSVVVYRLSIRSFLEKSNQTGLLEAIEAYGKEDREAIIVRWYAMTTYNILN